MFIFRTLQSQPATAISLIIGLVLIAVFPFGGAAYLAKFDSVSGVLVNSTGCRWFEAVLHLQDDYPCKSRTAVVEMFESHQWWEAIAFFWTLIFTLLFLWYDLPKRCNELNKDGQSEWSHRLLFCVFVVMSISSLLYLFGLGDLAPGYLSALAAKISLALTFVVVNLIIIWRANSLGLTEIASDFTEYNQADMASLFTLTLLLLWDQFFAARDIGDLSEFISGASSVILITTSFTFGISVLRDAYESMGGDSSTANGAAANATTANRGAANTTGANGPAANGVEHEAGADPAASVNPPDQTQKDSSKK